MNDFQSRVKEEKTELDLKISKLLLFLETSIFANLNLEEQKRMRKQSDLMVEYSKVLSERIAAF